MFLPDEGGKSRSIRISSRRRRHLLGLGIAGMSLLLAMVLSWGYLAYETARGWQLQALVDSLQAERSQVLSLAEEFSRVQEEYEHIRALFGSAEPSVSPDLWLPPSGHAGSPSTPDSPSGTQELPTTWPLTEPGYITQPLLAGERGDHPGLDIAIPTDSYIRAAGGGRVLRVGDDPLYGRFVVLEHDEGYQTVYAHASTILVERGERVRPAEVIALSGSTGRSTAAHLHFEILLNGLPVDPLSMVEQPG